MLNIASLMFVLVVGWQPLAAQTAAQTKDSGAYSQGSLGAATDTSRNVILTGNVVMADGSPPPQPVAIERVCGHETVRVGYTDAKGFFNFRLTEIFPAMQDASETGRDAYNPRSSVTFSTNSLGIPSFGTPAPSLGNETLTTGGCDLRGSLAGFRSTSVMIQTIGSTGLVNVGTLVLLSTKKQASSESATGTNAPKRAKKAYERASAHLQKRKFSAAQADLEEAVKLYPRYAKAWSDLGWLREQQNRLEEAREAFAHARDADDNFVPAYVGLASIAVRQSKWSEAQALSARAVQLGGKDYPACFYYNAVANFQLGQLEKAEDSARMGERLDVRHVLPQVNLLLGGILATKGDYAQAAMELKLYLKIVPHAPNTETVQQRLSELERLSTRSGVSLRKDAPPSASVAPGAEVSWETLTNWAEIVKTAGSPKMPLLDLPQSWSPPDIDQLVPPVSPGVSCPVRDVLSGVVARARELMENLKEFSATERIDHMEVDKRGNLRAPTSATFTYVVEIHKAVPGSLSVEEYRNGRISQPFPAELATKGMSAHALIFHPDVVGDFMVTCEGLGNIRGQAAWQLRFAQRPDHAPRFREYETPRGSFPVEMKGRAWIMADTYQVMRMETDLAKPIPEILLQKDHMIIDYRLVEFREHQLQLWLPETVEIWGDLLGHRFRRRHIFSNFELFWVDVAQKNQDPKSNGAAQQ